MVLSRCAIAIVVRPRHQGREPTLDLGLRLAVHRTRGLVEHQHRRVRRDGAREGEELPLADAHRGAPLAEHLVEAGGQARDDAVRAHPRRRREHRRVVERRVEADVGPHVGGEEEDVLLHVADQPPPLVRAAGPGCRCRSP